ncbi:hypothetical protein RvY_00079 [Ramazzottius varieornatus]|uniref:Uncharacterized protein n=1 Tax=Ramazzottius varieornatus TaxID=947166 RepID=A0A1D1UHT9_RAMVA|nr:hypothetical protein RvY_00079 [Ramazzottius varieornatus]
MRRGRSYDPKGTPNPESSRAVDALLAKPMLLDLVSQFLHRSTRLDSNSPISDVKFLSANDILDLLAPTIGCCYPLVEHTSVPTRERHRADHDKRHNGADQGRSNSTRRGRPKVKKEKVATAKDVPSTSAQDSPPLDFAQLDKEGPTDGPSVKQLVELYGQTQEQNKRTAGEIVKLKQALLRDYAGVMTEHDLDLLIGNARHPLRKQTLVDSIQHLFATRRKNDYYNFQHHHNAFDTDSYKRMRNF